MTGAIVLFAHGARDPRWAEPFEAVAARMRAIAPKRRIELAFLELMQPDLESAVGQLARQRETRIDVVPLFLGTGGHLRVDLPRLVERIRAAHPAVDLRLHPAIGESERVVDAMAATALALSAFGE
jgi:sirohydrochlorin cobaltochelatase